MRSHTTSMGTTALTAQYSLAQTAVVALAFTAAVVGGLLALAAPAAAAVVLVAGATAFLGRAAFARFRTLTRRNRRSTQSTVVDEA